VNLLKTKLRRTTAVLAGTVLGLAGVAALASPASAHSPVVLHSEPCLASNGSWAVIWKIGNDFRFDASYYRDNTYGGTIGFFTTSGSADACVKSSPLGMGRHWGAGAAQ